MNDTSTAAENFPLEGYRRMAPGKKIAQVCQLNDTVQRMALADPLRITRRVVVLLEGLQVPY